MRTRRPVEVTLCAHHHHHHTVTDSDSFQRGYELVLEVLPEMRSCLCGRDEEMHSYPGHLKVWAGRVVLTQPSRGEGWPIVLDDSQGPNKDGYQDVRCRSVGGHRAWGWDACKEEILPEIFLHLYVSHFYQNRDTISHTMFCHLPFPHSACPELLSWPPYVSLWCH